MARVIYSVPLNIKRVAAPDGGLFTTFVCDGVAWNVPLSVRVYSDVVFCGWLLTLSCIQLVACLCVNMTIYFSPLSSTLTFNKICVLFNCDQKQSDTTDQDQSLT